MAVHSRSLPIIVLVIAVALTAAVLLSSVEVGPREASLTRKVVSSDAFEAEVSYPIHVRPGEEVKVEVSVKGKGGFMVSAMVFRAYSCSQKPEPLMLGAELVYEGSTRPPEPRSELSTTYRFRLPEKLDEWLGLVIYVTPVKPGKPMIIHYTEPIVIPIKVEG